MKTKVSTFREDGILKLHYTIDEENGFGLWLFVLTAPESIKLIQQIEEKL